jgi:GntR family transcriptional regulator, transcriptional repressor for pyruvate dehydrogenase complex
MPRGDEMSSLLKPLKADSLIEVFVAKFEDLILSGKLQVGQRLPSERELALQLGVSRPVVHEGLVVLTHKGLVTMRPRAGAVINDFRREGSLNLLNSLINHQSVGLDPRLLFSMLDMRRLVEVENARLASINRTPAQLAQLESHLAAERAVESADLSAVCELDFEFHLQIAMGTGNTIYPLVLNSFKPFYMTFSRQFFELPAVIDQVFEAHRAIYDAIEAKESQLAVSLMEQLLDHGKIMMEKIILERNGGQ